MWKSWHIFAGLIKYFYNIAGITLQPYNSR